MANDMSKDLDSAIAAFLAKGGVVQSLEGYVDTPRRPHGEARIAPSEVVREVRRRRPRRLVERDARGLSRAQARRVESVETIVHKMLDQRLNLSDILAAIHSGWVVLYAAVATYKGERRGIHAYGVNQGRVEVLVRELMAGKTRKQICAEQVWSLRATCKLWDKYAENNPFAVDLMRGKGSNGAMSDADAALALRLYRELHECALSTAAVNLGVGYERAARLAK